MASAALPARKAAPRPAVPVYSAEEDVPHLPVANPLFLTLGIMTASLIQVLDSTIANVAIPHMQSSLGSTPDEISWVLTSYIVAVAVFMPITGWLADRIGSRRLFISSVAGFVISSMLCGMAQNVTEMVIFRALQGATGAFIAPLAQAAMIDTNKPSRQPQMMALWGIGIMIGPILGPLLGGWLTENWNWRWVFYVNVPLGGISLAILITALPSREVVRRRFDLAGFALLGTLLVSIQLLLDRGNHVDWFDAAESWIYAFLILSSAWMATIHFTTAKHTLFDRELFANPNFIFGIVFSLAMGVVMFATIALLPPMLQRLFGYGVIDTGEALMPRGVGTLITMQISGILVRRGFDPRILIAAGFSIAAYSLWAMSQWSLATDFNQVVIWGFVQGIGMGLIFIPLNACSFSTLPAHLRTEASSLLNLSRSIGSSIGISIVITLLGVSLQTSHADLAGHATGAMTGVIDFSTIDRFQRLGEAALVMLDGEINRQAAMIGYINDFYLMMWMTLAVIPLTFVMRRPQLGPPGPPKDGRPGQPEDPPDLPH